MITAGLENILLENEGHWMICVGLSISGPWYDVSLYPSLRGPEYESNIAHFNFQKNILTKLPCVLPNLCTVTFAG